MIVMYSQKHRTSHCFLRENSKQLKSIFFYLDFLLRTIAIYMRVGKGREPFLILTAASIRSKTLTDFLQLCIRDADLLFFDRR